MIAIYIKKNNLWHIVLPAALALSGCISSDDSEGPVAENQMAIIGKPEARELLLDAIDNYTDRSFQELVSEIGIGDDYYIISEADDGSKAGYSISVENKWHNESREHLFITATIYGPSPREGGIIPELHRESLVVRKY